MVSKNNIFSIWLVILFSFCLLPFESNAALVAHWTFDEGSGTQVVDTVSGIIGNLSATGASLVSGGKAGGALSLSKASSGYVTMGDVLNLGTGPYSFVVWVKTSTTDTTTAVLSKLLANVPAGYFIGINSDFGYGADNKAWFYNYNYGGEPISTTSVNDGQWHQIIVVRGSGEVKIYVDGLPVESSQTDQGLNNPPLGTPFLVGGYVDGSNPVSTYTGLIDDIQVYNHHLSDGEVQWLFDHPGDTLCTPAPSGLVSWWGGDNNALDMIGTNNGTLMNGATFAAGKVGQAFSFDGVDDYVEVPHNASLSFSPTSPMTVDLWAYRTSSSDGQHLLAKRTGCGSNDMNYQLHLNQNGLCFVGTDAGGNMVCTTGGLSDLPLSTWIHIAGTFDGSTLRLFINGQMVASNPSATLGPQNSAPLTIGALGPCSSNHPFGGLIDEVAIYNRALSADEIAAIYNAGSAGKCRIQYIVTANATGTGAGTVQSNVGGVNYSYPTVNSGTTSALTYGKNVVLTATASTGSTVAWTTCTGTAAGNGTASATCTYSSLSGNKTAAATFTLNSYNMTVTPSGTGSGTVTGNGLNCSWNGSSSGTCNVSLSYHTAVSLTATPSAGSAFSGWSGGSGSASGCSGTGACAFNFTQASIIGAIFIEKSLIYLPLILRL